MLTDFKHATKLILVLSAFAIRSSVANSQLLPDDERHIRWHQEESVSAFHRGTGPAPVTVATKEIEQSERLMTLDEAIRLTLQHSEVIRVLTGVSAVSSGQTIYDTAIATTPIDQAKALFDPVFSANSSFRHNEFPGLNPLGTAIINSQTGGNDTSVGLNDLNTFGGILNLGVANAWDNQMVAGFLNRRAPLGITQLHAAVAGGLWPRGKHRTDRHRATAAGKVVLSIQGQHAGTGARDHFCLLVSGAGAD